MSCAAAPESGDSLFFLVLHRLGNPELAPVFLRHHVFLLQDALPQHTFIYHDVALPLPDALKQAHFDAIVLDVTFLAVRWGTPEYFESVLHEYDFVRQSNAVKLAFPQDEYDCSELLDDWLVSWRVDCVFSVVSAHREVLYPRYLQAGMITLGFTGYINDELVTMARKPFAERRIDIGYRARKLPPYFGRLGETKWKIGPEVERHARAAGLVTDIVVGSEGTLNGRSWLDFINDCRFTLGANSGSSLVDPRGDIQRAVRALLRKHPEMSFEEVEQQCFPGLEGHFQMTAISPRVLEAALLESCQILVEGDYSGLVQPWEHFIPIRSDASDFQEVQEAMKDHGLVQRLIRNCRATILASPHLQARHHAERVVDLVRSIRSTAIGSRDSKQARLMADQYRAGMATDYAQLWRKEWQRSRLIQWIERYPPVARVAHVLNDLRKRVVAKKV